jgi:hypothetical protein
MILKRRQNGNRESGESSEMEPVEEGRRKKKAVSRDLEMHGETVVQRGRKE